MIVAQRDRLRIGIQKSGRLHEPSLALLQRLGLSFRASRDRLFLYGEGLAVDLLLVRDDDIPALIRDGSCDLGILGRNEVDEQSLALTEQGQTPGYGELRALGFGRCRLAIAVPQEAAYDGPMALAGKRIATSYPALLRNWLKRAGVSAEVIELAGSVEIAPRLGKAELICDLVSTGGTLAANQLREVAQVLESEAILIGAERDLGGARAALVQLLLRRLDAELRVRATRLVMFHAPKAALEAVLALLPAAEEPTLIPLNGSGWTQAQALCSATLEWEHLEALKAAGARHIVVVPVERMLS